MSIFNKVPKWSSFKSLGSSRIIKSSYLWLFLVPAIAKSLETLEDTVTFTVFGASININMSLPFSWTMFYFSAIFFAAASILFNVFCPKGIKRYNNYEDWRSDGKSMTSMITAFISAYRSKALMWPFVINNKELKHFTRNVIEYNGTLDDIDNRTPVSLYKHDVPDKCWKSTFFYVYDTYDVSKLLIRLALFIFYLFGFGFFFLVLFDNFKYVMSQL